MMRSLQYRLFFFLIVFIQLPVWATETLTWGVFAYRPKEILQQRYQPLADYLSEHLQNTRIELRVLDMDEIDEQMAHKQLDFLFTTPGHYTLLRLQNRLTGALATLISQESGHATSSLGGVIIARNDNVGINTLADLKGRKIAIPGTKFLGGYQTQAFELLKNGIYVQKDALIEEVGTHDNVVANILAGRAEVGFIRTGLIEELTAEGKLDPALLRVINPLQFPAFPYITSTRLYPEWAFVALPHVDSRQIRKVAAALLALDEDHPVVRAASIGGFAPPADYLPVETITRELHLPPFDQEPEITWQAIWQQYRALILIAATSLIVITLLLLTVARRNRALTRAYAVQRLERERTQNYLDTIQSLMVALDTQGRITMINRFACQLLGYAEAELIGQSWFATCLPQPEGMQQIYPIFRRIMNGEEDETCFLENEILLRNGNRRVIVWRNAYITNDVGKITGSLCSGQDITERKQAEATLRASEERMRTILDNVDGYIFLKDTEGRYLFANRAVRELWHAEIDEVVGYGDEKFFEAASTEVICANDRLVLEQGESIHADEILIVQGTGEIKTYQTTKLPLRDQQGHIYALCGISIDITARKTTEAELLRSRDELAYAQKVAKVGSWTINLETQALEWSAETYRMFGIPADQPVDFALFTSFIHPDDREQVLEAWNNALAGAPYEIEHRILIDDQVRWVQERAEFVRDNQGLMISALGTVLDITERKRSDEKLQLAASVFSHAREGIFITSPNGIIIDVNRAFTEITGFTRNDALGQNPRILKSGHQSVEYYQAMWQALLDEGHWYGEIWNRRKDGELYVALLTILAVRDQKDCIQHYVAMFSDITVQKANQQQLELIAHYDPLTGQANRVLLADRLRYAMAQAKRRKQQIAVAYIDLDGFKAVNDTYGHDIGDQLLIRVSERMKHALREGDTIARLGGDEFVAVLVDLSANHAGIPLIQRLIDTTAESVLINDIELSVSASVGISFYPQHDEIDPDQLMRQADQAMYQAKLAGKNRYHLFDSEIDRNERGRHEQLERIRQALEQQEFVLYYQPKVNLRSGEVIGAEALIRWQHPDRGLLSPIQFLPEIHNHSLCLQVGDWVLDTALAQLDTWREQGLDLSVSVNVSAHQLQQPNFVAQLKAQLNAYPDLPTGGLELEVLENSALEDFSRISQVIADCAEMGVSFALDDFGTGYSSLSYLKNLPAAVLKIDQSFVRDMLDDPEDLAILEGILGLVSAFRRQAVAEGVESFAHGKQLLQLGCDLAQGYYIARPMPADAIPAWIAGWQPDTALSKTMIISGDRLTILFAIVEHRAWVRAIEEYLQGRRTTPPPLDRYACRFGEWLTGTTARLLLPKDIDAQFINDLHQQAHIIAKELLEMHSAGKALDVKHRMPKLHSLRDELIGHLEKLLIPEAEKYD